MGIPPRVRIAQPMADFATRLVPLEDVGDRGLADLRDWLRDAVRTSDRLRIAATFMEGRLLGRAVARETAFVWSALIRSWPVAEPCGSTG